MIVRVLAGIFGAMVFGCLVPLVCWKTVGIPFHNFSGLFLVMGIGLVIGGALGALFPRPFAFLFESFLGD